VAGCLQAVSLLIQRLVLLDNVFRNLTNILHVREPGGCLLSRVSTLEPLALGLLDVLLKARAQVLRLLSQLLHKLVHRLILLASQLAQMGHRLEVIQVEALGHEHVLAVATESVLDLEELCLPLLDMILPADLDDVFSEARLLEIFEGLLVQLRGVDVKHRYHDVELRVVDQVARGVEQSLVDLIRVLIFDRF